MSVSTISYRYWFTNSNKCMCRGIAHICTFLTLCWYHIDNISLSGHTIIIETLFLKNIVLSWRCLTLMSISTISYRYRFACIKLAVTNASNQEQYRCWYCHFVYNIVDIDTIVEWIWMLNLRHAFLMLEGLKILAQGIQRGRGIYWTENFFPSTMLHFNCFSIGKLRAIYRPNNCNVI